jgi:hypothetical protein
MDFARASLWCRDLPKDAVARAGCRLGSCKAQRVRAPLVLWGMSLFSPRASRSEFRPASKIMEKIVKYVCIMTFSPFTENGKAQPLLLPEENRYISTCCAEEVNKHTTCTAGSTKEQLIDRGPFALGSDVDCVA